MKHESGTTTYLSRARVQEPHILRRLDTYQPACLGQADLDKLLFERQDVFIAPGCKRRGCTFPVDPPVVARAPSILVDEEREVGVAQQEFGRRAFNVDWFDVFATHDKVERCVGLIEQGLRFEGFEGDDFEAFGAADAELAAEEVDAV